MVVYRQFLANSQVLTHRAVSIVIIGRRAAAPASPSSSSIVIIIDTKSHDLCCASQRVTWFAASSLSYRQQASFLQLNNPPAHLALPCSVWLTESYGEKVRYSHEVQIFVPTYLPNRVHMFIYMYRQLICCYWCSTALSHNKMSFRQELNGDSFKARATKAYVSEDTE